jgi:ABC-2 type transport system ATP-binding protein
VAEGSPDQLRAGQGTGVIEFALTDGQSAADLPALADATITVDDHRVLITTTKLTEATHAVTAWALARGEELQGLSVYRPSLEDVYLELIANEREAGS